MAVNRNDTVPVGRGSEPPPDAPAISPVSPPDMTED